MHRDCDLWIRIIATCNDSWLGFSLWFVWLVFPPFFMEVYVVYCEREDIKHPVGSQSEKLIFEKWPVR